MSLHLALATLSLLPLAHSLHITPRDLDAQILPCYDYIIVGGGISGMVLANRLTEDPTVTVLVLEAGQLDNKEDFIMFPIDTGDGLWTEYDWNLFTTPQEYLDGKPRPWDMGRGIGGGSLINGMCWTRGGREDYDAWVQLGNVGWGWDDLLPYFKKSENYTDNVDAEFARELYIQPSPDTYGQEGYVHVSYPRYFYNQSQLFLDGLQELGIPILTDPNNGTGAGGMLIPDSISPDNQTRSYARLDYFDPIINTRLNLHVATHQHVSRLLINNPLSSRDLPAGLWVDGVEFLADGSLTYHNVTCSREIILSAGTVHSPQVLEMSGIGDPNILNQFGIQVLVELPGVGNNLQDHPYVGLVYEYQNQSNFNIDVTKNNAVLLDEVEEEWYSSKTGPWTAGTINTIAFPSLPSITTNFSTLLLSPQTLNSTSYLPPNLHPTLIAGYQAQTRLLTSLLSNPSVGAYELLNDNRGLLAVAAMHTFSRGTVHIQSLSPLQSPLINPRYLSHPLDLEVLLLALQFNNKLLNTSSMSLLQPTPIFQNATEEELIQVIKTGLRTEFHGSGSTSMLPLELGGVVDNRLRVYGVKNLRVVDAGVFPLVPASHLQAVVYGVAEKAADIIKADNANLMANGCGANSAFARPGPVLSSDSVGEGLGSTSASSVKINSSSGITNDTQSRSTSQNTQATNAIMDAASLFMSFISSAISGPSGSKITQAISSTQIPHFTLPSALFSSLATGQPQMAAAGTSLRRVRKVAQAEPTVFSTVISVINSELSSTSASSHSSASATHHTTSWTTEEVISVIGID